MKCDSEEDIYDEAHNLGSIDCDAAPSCGRASVPFTKISVYAHKLYKDLMFTLRQPSHCGKGRNL